MEERIITCIICPSSCQISIKGAGNKTEAIEGYGCKRGIEYAKAEYQEPVRNLTATVRAKHYKAPVVSVRTTKPIPKDMQMECMEIIKGLVAEPPYEIGRVIYQNILETGADIILTNN